MSIENVRYDMLENTCIGIIVTVREAAGLLGLRVLGMLGLLGGLWDLRLRLLWFGGLREAVGFWGFGFSGFRGFHRKRDLGVFSGFRILFRDLEVFSAGFRALSQAVALHRSSQHSQQRNIIPHSLPAPAHGTSNRWSRSHSR